MAPAIVRLCAWACACACACVAAVPVVPDFAFYRCLDLYEFDPFDAVAAAKVHPVRCSRLLRGNAFVCSADRGDSGPYVFACTKRLSFASSLDVESY